MNEHLFNTINRFAEKAHLSMTTLLKLQSSAGAACTEMHVLEHSVCACACACVKEKERERE